MQGFRLRGNVMKLFWLKTVAAALIAGVVAAPVALPPVAAQSLAAPEPSSSWPHNLVVNGARIVVYQPQAIAWPDRKRLTARAAVAITPAGAKTPDSRHGGCFARHPNRRGDRAGDPVRPEARGIALRLAQHR